MSNTSPTANYDISTLRSTEFPITQEVTYLNHAGISPLPLRSTRAAQKIIGELGQFPEHYYGYFFQNNLFPLLENFDKSIAKLINAPNLTDIAPMPNTSTGINRAAGAINWQAGDTIIICDIEFPSNVYPWLALERRGVKVKMLPPQNGTLTVEALDKAVDKNTRLVAVSSLQFFTGARSDLQALGNYCHERNLIFAVDCIQSAAHIPLDVQAQHIDILATGGYKSLMGLPGSGFLYVRSELAEQMNPATIGASSVQNYEHWLAYDTTPATGAKRFASGLPSVAGLVSVVEGQTLLQEIGIANIDTYTTALAHQAIQMLTERSYPVVTPSLPEQHGSIVTFQYDPTHEKTDVLMQRLNAAKVSVTKHLDREGAPYVRLSVHCYNTMDDLQRFFELL